MGHKGCLKPFAFPREPAWRDSVPRARCDQHCPRSMILSVTPVWTPKPLADCEPSYRDALRTSVQGICRSDKLKRQGSTQAACLVTILIFPRPASLKNVSSPANDHSISARQDQSATSFWLLKSSLVQKLIVIRKRLWMSIVAKFLPTRFKTPQTSENITKHIGHPNLDLGSIGRLSLWVNQCGLRNQHGFPEVWAMDQEWLHLDMSSIL